MIIPRLSLLDNIKPYPLVNVNKKLLKMAIEIVDFPIKKW
jgi:hypothetical protein